MWAMASKPYYSKGLWGFPPFAMVIELGLEARDEHDSQSTAGCEGLMPIGLVFNLSS